LATRPTQQRSLLPLLGGLLALFLISGAVLAARNARGSDTTNPSAVPTTAPAAAATAAPEPQPTPTPPSELSAVPTELATTLDRLGLLLQSGIQTGQAGEDGPSLLKRLDQAERALAGGDKQAASEQLGELAKLLHEGAADGKVDASFAQQSLQLIGAAAAENGLTIQPPQPPGDDNNQGGGKGKGKGKGN